MIFFPMRRDFLLFGIFLFSYKKCILLLFISVFVLRSAVLKNIAKEMRIQLPPFVMRFLFYDNNSNCGSTVSDRIIWEQPYDKNGKKWTSLSLNKYN